MFPPERWLPSSAVDALPNFAVSRGGDQIQFQLLMMPNARLQPRRLIIQPAAVGCKPMLCRPSFGLRVQGLDHGFRISRRHSE